MIDLSILQPYYPYIISLLILAAGIFCKAYLQEKAKQKALKSENKKLVEETEKIKSQFNKELEELKKEHQLDISRRKYQYESKKEQYIKFFQLLDSFTHDANTKNQEQLMEILNEFNRNYLNASLQNNSKNQNNAVVVMSKKIQHLTFQASQDLFRVKQETNTIKLIASDEVLKKLDLLQLAFDKSIEKSNKVMSDLPKLMMINDQEAMAENQKGLEISGLVTKQITEEIIEIMRKELQQI